MCPTLATPCTLTCQAPLSTGFPRQEYWSGLSFLPQGIFPTKGSYLHLLPWQMDSLPLSHGGSPRTPYISSFYGHSCQTPETRLPITFSVAVHQTLVSEEPNPLSLCATHKPTNSPSPTFHASSAFLHQLPLLLSMTIQAFPNLLTALSYFPLSHSHQMTSSLLSLREWKSFKNKLHLQTYLHGTHSRSLSGARGGLFPPTSPCVLQPLRSHLLRSPTLLLLLPLPYAYTSSFFFFSFGCTESSLQAFSSCNVLVFCSTWV